jgi:lysophospholipase L1-like esterase
MSEPKESTFNMSRVLVLGTGFLFLLAALINEFFVPAHPESAANDVTVTRIREVQTIFLVTGLLFITLSFVIRRVSWLESFTRKDAVANTLLAVLPVLSLLFILELSLKPFAESRQLTTIFVRDSELGWKLKPNAEDVWGEVPVKINGKGFIGPELDYTKPPGVKRILYLGDSVTFGYRLKDYRQSFPFRTEPLLERKLACEIETINAGIGGYSPWQEHILLSTEGVKYEPDLIVVCFVLNDVTAKFALFRFGGGGEGYQLSHTASNALEKSLGSSSIYYFARKIGGKIRFGSNVQQGAERKETLDVADIVYFPGRPDVREAWDVTLENLEKIFIYAKEKDVPIVLAVFPFAFQFYDVTGRSAPQRTVSAYALDNGIPTIDLLPLMSRRIVEEGRKPEDYFLDTNHLSPIGSDVVAEILADFIHSEGLLIDGAHD